MAVDIYLKRCDGSVVDEGISDYLHLIQQARVQYDEVFPCIYSIQEYDVTLFNTLQVNAFLIEWEQVRIIADTVEKEAVWKSIKQMAQRSLSEGHYLLFLGD